MKDVAKIKCCLIRHVPDKDDRNNLIGVFKQFDPTEEFDAFVKNWKISPSGTFL